MSNRQKKTAAKVNDIMTNCKDRTDFILGLEPFAAHEIIIALFGLMDKEGVYTSMELLEDKLEDAGIRITQV